MAQYFTDFSGETLGSIPAGWSTRWAAGSGTFLVVEDETATGGKALHAQDSNNSQVKGLTLDAADGDAGVENSELVMRWKGVSGFSLLILGVFARGSGSAHSSANYYCAQMGTGAQRRIGKRINGAPTTIQSAAFSHVLETWYWMRLRVSGTTIQVKHWTDGETEPEAWTFTSTETELTGAGWVGIVLGSQNSSGPTARIDLIGVGTNGDAAPTSAPGATPVSFSGTIPTQNATEGTPFSVGLSSYFSGTETPFTYSLQSGTLPTGLTLNSSTGVISGTPTTAGTASGIVIRATDDNSDTADSNAFSITVAAAHTVVLGVRIRLYDGSTEQGNLTGLTVAWFDDPSPATFSSPVFQSNTATTDASGWLEVDLDNDTMLDIDDPGFLIVYKADADPEDDLVFAGRLPVEDIA